jgi:hypothetical protein
VSTKRFIGYNPYGEDVPNILYPPDLPAPGTFFDTNKWVIEPWRPDKNEDMQEWLQNHPEQIIQQNAFDGNKEFRESIILGLKIFHTEEFNNSNPSFPWENYVHIITPPTYYGWGWGRGWHVRNGQVLYRSFPIAPNGLSYPIGGNLSTTFVSFDPPMPLVTEPTTGVQVYEAEPLTSYTGTVKFRFGSKASPLWYFENVDEWIRLVQTTADGKQTEIPLKFASGAGSLGGQQIATSEVSFAPSSKNYQKAVFSKENSEITATFSWIPQSTSKSISAGINWEPSFWRTYEYDPSGATPWDRMYEDNSITIPIKVKKLPDLFIDTLNSGTKLTEPGKAYTGTVSFGLYDTFDQPVTAKISLTHNGYPVPEADGRTITLEPGQILPPMTCLYHGIDNTDSVLEAGIIPLTPVDKDINMNNNTRRVTVKAKRTDIAVQNIVQASPVTANSSQYAKVSFANMGTQEETFTAHYYAGSARVKSETLTIPAGGIIEKAFNWTAPSAIGNIVLRVIADPAQQLADQNRNNNTALLNVTIEEQEPPPTQCIEGTNNTSSTWTERYSVITGYDIDGHPIWSTETETYNETLAANIRLNTKQGLPTLKSPNHLTGKAGAVGKSFPGQIKTAWIPIR